MIEKILERISVLSSYNRDNGEITIHKLRWNGRSYSIVKMGYHHKVRAGRNIFHVFHVNNDSLAFKLQLDTENLTWWILEVSDGNPN
jgi:hypothetical protein